MRTLLLLLLLLPASAADGDGPVLVGPGAVSPTDTTLSFTLSAPPGATLWIEGCDPVEIERQTATGWAASVLAVCEVPKVATAVDGQITLTVPRPGPGTYRALVTYGTSCVAGRPLVVAACKKLGFVRSAAVTIP